MKQDSISPTASYTAVAEKLTVLLESYRSDSPVVGPRAVLYLPLYGNDADSTCIAGHFTS